jgi:hypothetical protein
LLIVLGLAAGISLCLGRHPHSPDVTVAMVLAAITTAAYRAMGD